MESGEHIAEKKKRRAVATENSPGRPLHAGAANGQVRARMAISESGEVIRVEFDVRFRR